MVSLFAAEQATQLWPCEMDTLKRIRDTLFWRQSFDDAFRCGKFQFPLFGLRDEQALEEKCLYWREVLGKRFNCSPSEAAFRAFEAYADDYYMRHRDDPSAEPKFQALANGLLSMALHVRTYGPYKARETLLSDRWQEYLAAYRKWYEEEKAHRDELAKIRFSPAEIAEQWELLASGEILESATKVWKAVQTGGTPHEISSITGLPVSEVMLWLLVFREQAMVSERASALAPLYSRDARLNEYIQNDEELEMVVEWLEEVR